MPLFKPGNAGVFGVKHDVVGREGWQALLDEVKSKFGKLHLVVNNAGIKTLKPASQATAEEWDYAMAVNVTAIVQSVAVILPHMLEHGEGGHFVTTSSMSGLLPAVTAGVYSATKIAAVGVMEALRVELEGTNIGTSAFCPGGTNTDNYAASGQPNPARKAGAAALRQLDGSARGGRARDERGGEQRPLHREPSGVRGRDEAALRLDDGLHARGRNADPEGAHRPTSSA